MTHQHGSAGTAFHHCKSCGHRWTEAGPLRFNPCPSCGQSMPDFHPIAVREASERFLEEMRAAGSIFATTDAQLEADG